MRALELIFVHYAYSLRMLSRQLSYVVPILGFPVLFYAFFGLSHSTPAAGRYIMASFMAFGVLGVCVFQFGAGIALDRATSWERYLRTLQVSTGVRLAARLLTAVTFAVLTSAEVALVAVLFGHVTLDPLRWVLLFVALLAGSIPLTLLGITIGYFATPRGAVPIANLIYLTLAFGGGLFTPPPSLPPGVAQISPFLITRDYADVVWSTAGGFAPGRFDVAMLAGYAVVLFAAAAVGYRRDEALRYA